jgi:hypothetical protein
MGRRGSGEWQRYVVELDGGWTCSLALFTAVKSFQRVIPRFEGSDRRFDTTVEITLVHTPEV